MEKTYKIYTEEWLMKKEEIDLEKSKRTIWVCNDCGRTLNCNPLNLNRCVDIHKESQYHLKSIGEAKPKHYSHYYSGISQS